MAWEERGGSSWGRLNTRLVTGFTVITLFHSLHHLHNLTLMKCVYLDFVLIPQAVLDCHSTPHHY